MSTMEERTAARQAYLEEQQNGEPRQYNMEDFVWDMAQEKFWDVKWLVGPYSDKVVDKSIPVADWPAAPKALVEVEEEGPKKRGPKKSDKNKPSGIISQITFGKTVQGTTWAPGKPKILDNQLVDAVSMRHKKGARTLNLYIDPPEFHGDAGLASPWVEHIKKLWPAPEEHDYFLNYCAHMVQRPQDKCNTTVVMSGTQGIGKDAALKPVKEVIGIWNTANIGPDQLLSQYQPWKETVLLVVDEARPSQSDFHATAMYNELKILSATPPDTLPLNQKYMKQRYVMNVMRVVITTNSRLSMYIPREDRRIFLMHSTLPRKWHEIDGRPDYFKRLFNWMDNGGVAHIAAWLKARDISNFDPKAEAPRTKAWNTVSTSWTDGDNPIANCVEVLEKPNIIFNTEMLMEHMPTFDGKEEIRQAISNRKAAHRFEELGYVAVKPREAGARFAYKVSGKLFRASIAYVKETWSEKVSEVDMYEAIAEHGRALAERMP
jgi:hypothetical protein